MNDKPFSSPARLSRISETGGYFSLWRMIKDKLLRYSVFIGGIGVILTITMMFLYLVFMAAPLFLSPVAEQTVSYQLPVPSAGKTVLLSLEEQNKLAARLTDQGRIIFFEAQTGRIVNDIAIPLTKGAALTSVAVGKSDKSLVAVGFSDGKVLVFKQHYALTFEHDQQGIVPSISFPFGQTPVTVAGEAISKLAVAGMGETVSIAGITASGRLILTKSAKSEFDMPRDLWSFPAGAIEHLLLDKAERYIYAIDTLGSLHWLRLNTDAAVLEQGRQALVEPGVRLSSVALLNGHLSLLVGNDAGSVAQWTWVRDDHNQPGLRKLRTFEVSGRAVVLLESEQRRKGFISIDADGGIGVLHSTSERQLLKFHSGDKAVAAIALGPRASALLIESGDGTLAFRHLTNNHPEVSLKSLWQKIWYESYAKPDYIWQSSSASSDFEPKYSLTPLVFGTLKAAFYALLFAVPLALAGAIYTAYFMAPAMRNIVKPGIEIMEALPTVILGFLAGLWLAPFMENNLFGIFLSLLMTPVSVLLLGYGLHCLPESLRHYLPKGWEAAVLMPVIVAVVWLCLRFGGSLEPVFFEGGIKNGLARWGMEYDQRNALVVGIAMGFAVIPGIFSIAEDAIFNVPRHLAVGSLALGATRWQTMTRVVLLTASPGIFSAIIVGFGRAVGETMIVLMATGNSPVMDLSVFQGMRTLSATIAVEMPESEIDSTHYRILFLAALLLFLFTFFVNTLAEWIRQRLRDNYSVL